MYSNAGAMLGDEAVQIDIRDDVSSITRPAPGLKAFQRVTLNPAKAARWPSISSPPDLWLYNAEMKRVVEPGTFVAYAAPNSVELKSAKLTAV